MKGARDLACSTALALAVAAVGCDSGSSSSGQGASPTSPATAPAGMSKYPYLAADGGPHILLPAEAANLWTPSSIASLANPKSDYSRACAATASTQMALIPVGGTSAMVFQDPPMTSWGKSADGLVEIYYLKSWNGTNLDGLIAKATAALPTGSLTDSGLKLSFRDPDAFLLFAGDAPSSTAYGVHRVTIPTGTYGVFTGTYSSPGESVTIYQLKPLNLGS